MSFSRFSRDRPDEPSLKDAELFDVSDFSQKAAFSKSREEKSMLLKNFSKVFFFSLQSVGVRVSGPFVC